MVIFGKPYLSFLRVKTPAEDINDDVEKGEMVIEDREQRENQNRFFL